jgi:hypothetical protein
MIYKSPILSEASGSLAGLTFSRNKGGAYVRARVVPTNPGSIEQEKVRDAMKQLSAQWRDVLTTAQRDAWTGYALATPVKNALGEWKFITALAHYVRSNSQRSTLGLAVINDAPSVPGMPDFTPAVVTVAAATDIASIAFTNTDEWAIAIGGFLTVYISRPQPASINYFKGPYRHLKTIAGLVIPPTSPATQALDFPCVAAQRLFYKINALTLDGRRSGDQSGFCVSA